MAGSSIEAKYARKYESISNYLKYEFQTLKKKIKNLMNEENVLEQSNKQPQLSTNKQPHDLPQPTTQENVHRARVNSVSRSSLVVHRRQRPVSV